MNNYRNSRISDEASNVEESAAEVKNALSVVTLNLNPPNQNQPSTSSHSLQSQRVLSSWKEIATFLGKGVRTVQRWERQHGLPVRRPGGHVRIVLAYPEELERWMGPAVGTRQGESSAKNDGALNSELVNARRI